MAATLDPSKLLVRTELSQRVREAVECRNWEQLEYWSRQWIQLDGRSADGFKWLARASLAQNKLKNAAYAYGRLLDFDPANLEAKKFFAQNPSKLENLPQQTITQMRAQKEAEKVKTWTTNHLLKPESRKELASLELELAQKYFNHKLFAEAADRFKQSYEWHPSQISALGHAKALHLQGRGLEAIRFLRHQLTQFPDWVEGWILVGKVNHQLGHATESQKAWQQALRLDQNNIEALDLLKNIFLQRPMTF